MRVRVCAACKEEITHGRYYARVDEDGNKEYKCGACYEKAESAGEDLSDFRARVA